MIALGRSAWAGSGWTGLATPSMRLIARTGLDRARESVRPAPSCSAMCHLRLVRALPRRYAGGERHRAGRPLGGGWGRERPTRCRWGAGGDASGPNEKSAGRILIHRAYAGEPSECHRLVSMFRQSGPDAHRRDGVCQPAYPFVDALRDNRGVRQPQRVLAAFEQEVAALDHGHVALGRRRQQLRDLDIVGQLDPEEVAAVRLGEAYAWDVLAQRGGEPARALGQGGAHVCDGPLDRAGHGRRPSTVCTVPRSEYSRPRPERGRWRQVQNRLPTNATDAEITVETVLAGSGPIGLSSRLNTLKSTMNAIAPTTPNFPTSWIRCSNRLIQRRSRPDGAGSVSGSAVARAAARSNPGPSRSRLSSSWLSRSWLSSSWLSSSCPSRSCPSSSRLPGWAPSNRRPLISPPSWLSCAGADRLGVCRCGAGTTRAYGRCG